MALQFAVSDALLLLASAGHKLIGWRAARRAVQQFGGVPESLTTAVLVAVLAAELCAAALLLGPAHRAAGGVSAAGLWTVYLGFMVRALVLGRRDVDCGCSFGAHRAPLGAFHWARNAVLVLTAVVVALAATHAGGPLRRRSFWPDVRCSRCTVRWIK